MASAGLLREQEACHRTEDEKGQTFPVLSILLIFQDVTD
jgi:hypothetical protein